jgi:hypothetical protein
MSCIDHDWLTISHFILLYLHWVLFFYKSPNSLYWYFDPNLLLPSKSHNLHASSIVSLVHRTWYCSKKCSLALPYPLRLKWQWLPMWSLSYGILLMRNLHFIFVAYNCVSLWLGGITFCSRWHFCIPKAHIVSHIVDILQYVVKSSK